MNDKPSTPHPLPAKPVSFAERFNIDMTEEHLTTALHLYRTGRLTKPTKGEKP